MDSDSSSQDETPAAVRALLECLRQAREEYQSGQDAGRIGAIWSLNCIIEFLNASDEVRRDGLADPLLHLSVALSDLDDGIPSPVFHIERRVGRKPDSLVRIEVRAFSVFTVDSLMSAGLLLDKATKLVAKTLRKCGIERHGKAGDIKAITIKKWREDIQADFGTTLAAQSHKDLVVYRTRFPGHKFVMRRA